MDYYNNIENYLSGKLEGEELKAFKEAMLSDDELLSLVENYKSIKVVSSGILENELLSEIQAVQLDINGDQNVQKQVNVSDEKETEPSENASLAKWFLVGLLLFGFMILMQFLIKSGINKNEPTNITELVAQVYTEPLWPVKRGENDRLGTAIGEFEYGDRKKAISILTDSLSQTKAGSYWLSELYFKERNSDSTLLYLPLAKEYPSKSDRINCLRMLSYVLQNKKDKARTAAAQVEPQYITKDLSRYLNQ